MMDMTVRLMSEKDEQEFIELVIDFAERKTMTVSNITNAIKKVIDHMNDNATLEKGTAE